MSQRRGMTHTNVHAPTLAEFQFALISARILCVAPPTEMVFSRPRVVRRQLLHPAMSLTCKLLTIPIPKAMMLNGTSGLRVHRRLAAKLGKKIERIFDFIVIIVTKHPPLY